MHENEMFLGCGTRLASAGYAVIGIDYEGHGRSRGARCYIKKFNNIVSDCNDFFKSVCGRLLVTFGLSMHFIDGNTVSQVVCWCISVQEEYRDKNRFLYGESMGGAVALLLHKKDPNFWNGAVLVAPMCKVNARWLCDQLPNSTTCFLLVGIWKTSFFSSFATKKLNPGYS